MKYIVRIKILLLIIVISFLSSCGSSEEVSENSGIIGNAELEISEKSINTTVVGEVRRITVTSPDAWTAKPNKTWVSVIPSSGEKGTCEVEIGIELNDTGLSRVANVIFSSGVKSERVRVLQDVSDYFLLPCEEYKVSYQGGNIAVGGLPEDYTIAIAEDAQEWVSVEGNMLTVSYNTSTLYDRSTTLTITDADGEVVYEVQLMQESIPTGGNILPLRELIIDGYHCPSDSFTDINDFLYSVRRDASAEVKAKVEFAGDDIEWITLAGSATKIYSGDEVTFPALTPGSTITIYSHNSQTSKIGENTLMVTGVPIMTITTTQDIPNEPKVDCDIALFDPEARISAGEDKNLVYYECKAGIEQRGNGALRYPKKSYNFKLKDATGGKVEAKLLGIRNDNSWILDAMYLDLSRMRNRVCFDLWNTFNRPYYVAEKPKAMSGTRGHYVEVFINGKYNGLYCLSDRIDRKQFQIEQQGGYIYKAKHSTDATLLRGYKTPSNDDYYWNSAHIEQEYPDADDGMAPNFNYMAEFIEFISKSDNATLSAQFADRIAENSIIDAFIYLNLIVAHDNMGWNLYWVYRNVNEQNRKIILCLWDLDGSFGRNWCRVKENAQQGWVKGNFNILHRIINGDVEGLQQKIYDRWEELKYNQLEPTKFDALVDYYADLQISTGARDREIKRWRAEETKDAAAGTNGWVHYTGNYGDVEGEVAYMKQWYRDRMEKLDEMLSAFNKQ